MMPCAVCRTTGWVEERPRVATTSSNQCPYNACGGKCQGKGYYDYYGHTIWCHLG